MSLAEAALPTLLTDVGELNRLKQSESGNWLWIYMFLHGGVFTISKHLYNRVATHIELCEKFYIKTIGSAGPL